MNVSESENVDPVHQKFKSYNFGSDHIWTIRSLNTRFLSISKSTSLLDNTAHISTFRALKTLFLSFNNSTLLLDSTAHIWTFRNLKTPFLTIGIYHLAVRYSPYMSWKSLKKRFLSISKSKFFNVGTTISENFATWIRDSWASANRTSCRIALLISNRCAAWKRHSWQSANRPLHFGTNLIWTFRCLKAQFRNINKSTT